MRRISFAVALLMCGSFASAQQVLFPTQPLFAGYSAMAPATRPSDDSSQPLFADYPAQTPGSQQQQYYGPAPAPVTSWQSEISIAFGYSDVEFSHAHNGSYYDPSGAYFDINAMFPIPGLSTPVFGFGFTGSGYWDSKDTPLAGTLYSNVNMVALEARISAPIPTTSGQGFFLIPRIGAGPLFNNYGIQTPNPGGLTYSSDYHNGIAFEVRPYIEAGYRFSQTGSIGIEGSYMWGWGDFGDLGSITQEARVGIVFAYRF
jgi:hypothetical protein